MVGALSYQPDTEAFKLTYEPAWVGSRTGYALSPHLPLHGPSSSAAIRRFLENLLPEGRALDVASRYSNIQKNNIFGLIRYLGQESAGALTFLPAGQTPQIPQTPKSLKESEPGPREITPAELQHRIERRNELPFTVWDGQVRMSVAGFQDKLLVSRVGDRLFLVDGNLSSTHILKPEPISAALPCMVANEHFCMALASRISLKRYGQNHAAQVSILRLPAPVLCVQRFDREVHADCFALGPDGVQVPMAQRLHIIDACQATDVSVAAKYERNLGNGTDVAHIRDGASFERVFDTRQYLAQPAVGVRRMVMWAVTTLLMGNSDAHGKNLSFYVNRDGLSVAPLYDLVSVMQYDAQKLEHDLAMAFGDEFNLFDVKAFALADFCERAKVSRMFFARELVVLCELAVGQALAQREDPVYQGDEVAWVGRIAEFVVQRAGLLMGLARDIPKFGKDLF